MTTLHPSPYKKSSSLFLNPWHSSLGAHFVSYAGVSMPAFYKSGIVNESLACRKTSALFDVSHMGQCTITGESAGAFLSRICPADVLNQKIGSMRYTVFLGENGGILDDTIVTRTQNGYRVVVNASRCALISEHFEQHCPPNTILSWHNNRVLLALQGPDSSRIVSSLFPEYDFSTLGFMNSTRLAYGQHEIWCSRCGYTGEDGFELSVPDICANSLIAAIVSDGTVVPAGLGARDILRLEAGLPLYGQDIDTGRNPVEANLTWVIPRSRRTEGGFIGHEHVLAALENRPAHILRGYRFDGKQPVRTGAKLTLSNNELVESDVVGWITSGTYSPSLGPVALGYINRDIAPDVTIFAWQRGRPHTGVRQKLPFVPHHYYRPPAS